MKIKILLHNIKAALSCLACYWRMAMLKLYVFNAKHKWYRSNYGNDYNPILNATIYKCGDIYKIARYEKHFGYYQSRKEAMLLVYEIWLKEFDFKNKMNDYAQKANEAKERITHNTKKLIGQQRTHNTVEQQNASFSAVSDPDLREQAHNAPKAVRQQNEIEVPHQQKQTLKDSLSVDLPQITTVPDLTKNEDLFASYKADYFYLSQAEKNCYKCKRDTKVYAIVLPAGFISLDYFALEDYASEELKIGEIPYFSNDYYTILSYVTYISKEALHEIYKIVKKFYFQKAYSYTTKHSYYRSVCTHCGAPQGDNFTIVEFNSPFMPRQLVDLSKISFFRIEVPIRANGEDIRLEYDNEKIFDHIPNVAYEKYLTQKASQS